MSVDDSRGTWCDFGSGLSGGKLDLAVQVLGCDRREAWRYIVERFGMVLGGRADFSPMPRRAPKSEGPTNDQVRIDQALAVWRETVPLPGTTAEDYYRSRRLTLDGLGHAVRFHPHARFGLKHHPCVVALMRDIVTDEPCGIHRTALDDGGLKIARRMLGRAKGSAIKLVNDVDVTMGLSISEGVETALSILQAGWSPVWALGSAGAIERFPVLPGVEHLTLWADHDDVGLAAAKTCAQRWAGSGAEATVRYPAAADSDFNDGRPV